MGHRKAGQSRRCTGPPSSVRRSRTRRANMSAGRRMPRCSIRSAHRGRMPVAMKRPVARSWMAITADDWPSDITASSEPSGENRMLSMVTDLPSSDLTGGLIVPLTRPVSSRSSWRFISAALPPRNSRPKSREGECSDGISTPPRDTRHPSCKKGGRDAPSRTIQCIRDRLSRPFEPRALGK